MARSRSAEPAGSLVRMGWYTQSHLAADPETEEHVPLVRDPLRGLTLSMQQRRDADDQVMAHEAKRDFRLRVFVRCTERFSAKAFGHFESRSAPGFVRLFPVTARQLGLTPEKDRDRVLGEFMEAVQDSRTPPELAAAAAPVSTAWSEFRVAQQALEERQKELARAKSTEEERRVALITALTRLQGRLQDQFPNDRERVASYLRSGETPKPKKAKAASAPAPAPAPVDPVAPGE